MQDDVYYFVVTDNSGYLWFLFMIPETVGDFRMPSFYCGTVALSANLFLSTWIRGGMECVCPSQESCLSNAELSDDNSSIS